MTKEGGVEIPELEKIEKYRELFVGWALVIGFLSFVAGLWTTAPTLDVQMPLVGGAQIGLNVGYLFAVGIPVITFAQAWLLAPLFAMRGYQSAILEQLRAQGGRLPPAQRVTFLGQTSAIHRDTKWALGAYRVATAMKWLLIIAMPVIAQVWIGVAYFDRLRAYNKEATISMYVKQVLAGAGKSQTRSFKIPHDRITVGQFFFTQDLSGSTHFSIENGEIESTCMALWVRDALRERKVGTPTNAGLTADALALLADLETETRSSRCIFDAFPRYQLAVNSWANLLFLGVSVWLGVVTFNLYRSRHLVDAIDAMNIETSGTPSDPQGGTNAADPGPSNGQFQSSESAKSGTDNAAV
jgi:hypothetical protein